MAGGLVYTAVDPPSLSTAEIYGKTLAQLAKDHKEVVALTADLATSTKLADFISVCPERLFNVGIAEQNMFGVAAGMAKAGLVPFLSTFSVFASLRSADQLHTDICYQNVNAKIIATHSGTSFGQAGSTHHAIVDLAVVRSMPNLTVICPADGYETANAVKAAYEKAGATKDMTRAELCEALVKAIKEISFDGLTGQDMTWSDKGEVNKMPTAVVIKDGVYVSAEAAE